MKAKITDREALMAVPRAAIASWLRANGWVQQGTWNNLAVFDRPTCSNRAEVGVPMRGDAPDYALRISEVIRSASGVLDRSQLDVLHEIEATQVDRLRLRVGGARFVGGRMPIRNGSDFFNRTRDLVLAGACAAIERKAVFGSRKRAQAIDFLDHAEFRAPEEGSFVVVVDSIVSPKLSADLFEEDPDPPFERQVMKTLIGAVHAAMAAVEDASMTGSVDPFLSAVQHGVSAQLCDSLAGMLEAVDGASLGVQIGWGRTRPIPSRLPTQLSIGADAFPVLSSAATELRTREPIEEFEVEGPVIRLERSPVDSSGGDVFVSTLVDGRPSKVRATLAEDEYQRAIAAHGTMSDVRILGTLQREGRTLRLVSPRLTGVDVSD